MMKTKKILSILLAALLLLTVLPIATASAYSKAQATLTFTNNTIVETAAGSGYTIKGTTLTITASGTYRITGSSTEGSVVVGKELSGVTLILDNLSLTSSQTAPIVIKKSSSALIKLVGETTLIDSEDASTEDTNSDFEGAAIKVKSGSSLTIFGDGTLNAAGNAKNAVKGASESSLKVDGGTINATAASNGIAFDGSILINAGTFNVTAGNDGIKSQPDKGDTASAGTVTINGGDFTVKAQGDGIVAAEKLTINNGTFDIKTLNGYQSSTFNKNTMSCKGLKVSSNNASETEPTNELIINGGTFSLNTADDAIHSDGYCDITGGTLYIYAGDDGVHADATLTLGTENGYERDPEIYVYSSYEGLEGSTVNAYSGKFYVKASDDGVNAAGGSSNGTEPGGNQDPFRPGGNRPGQGGFNQGGFNPGNQGGNTSTSNYSINIYGGSFYVDCEGDGLDSNGTLNLLGGDITVLSMRSGGDNSPLDADGTITVNGATVFAAGSRGMGVNLSSSSQKAYTSTSSYNSGTVINIKSSGTTLRSEKLVRNISYLLYSEPNLGTCSVSTGSAVDSCKSNAFAHNWDKGTIVKAASENSAGLIKYTCSNCSAVEYKTIPALASATEYIEEETASLTETETVTETVTETTSETEAATTEPTETTTETQTESTEPTETVAETQSTSTEPTETAAETQTTAAEPTETETQATATESTDTTTETQSATEISQTEPTSTEENAQSSDTTTVKKTKKVNTIKAKAVTKSVKAKKTKKSKVTVKKAITVTKAKGTVTYTKVSGSKKLTINSKTGAITVKKGTAKGTYKIKVKVTAKGTKTYKKGSKTVIVTIKVK